MERSGMMRCRPGIVTHTTFATIPDQRCTASHSLALHRIRDTSHLILAPMGSSPRGDTGRRGMLDQIMNTAGAERFAYWHAIVASEPPPSSGRAEPRPS